MATTAINALELYVGIVEVENVGGKRIQKTRGFLDGLMVFNFDQKSAVTAAAILNSLKRLSQPIGLKDALIASIALENSL